jgi:hypothetical protein
MSYCRFSSDDFHCDVYVYEHCYGGFMTHVAANRVVGDVPKIDWPQLDDIVSTSVLHAQYMAQMRFMETAKRAPIGLPHDGKEFVDDTPGDCADRLESLREIGYNVPQSAIDALREEQLTFKDSDD